MGDTPKTLGREESLHPLGISDLEIGDMDKGLRLSAHLRWVALAKQILPVILRLPAESIPRLFWADFSDTPCYLLLG